MLHNNIATSIFFLVSKRLVDSASGKHTDEKGKETCYFDIYAPKIIFYFSVSALFFQRVDLPGARTGGLPTFAGSSSRGAHIFLKKRKKYKKEKM